MFKLICIIAMVSPYINKEIQARILDQQQIRDELSQQGFPEDQLNDWVCLIEAESSGNTDVVGPPNDDGSRDYGLFQINSRYWCSDSGQPGNGCDVTCQEVAQDDITKAAECAKKIFQVQGFPAWTGWRNKCQ